jgi:superfamily II DNA or RNA helicase
METSSGGHFLRGLKLHAWQGECLERWLANGCRGVAGVATGAGKTLLALAAVERIAQMPGTAPLRVKIIVPKVFLAHQWRADIIRHLGVARGDISLYCGDIKENPEKPFVIYVLNTARFCVSRHILREMDAGRSVLLICDECHHFGSAVNSRVFDFIARAPADRYFALGLSATPECEGFDASVAPALGPVIYRYGISEATADSVTSGYAIFSIAVDFSPEEGADYEMYSDDIAKARGQLMSAAPYLMSARGAALMRSLQQLQRRDDKIGNLARRLMMLYIRRKEVLHLARSRADCAVGLVKELISDSRIIVFAERIETVELVYSELDALYPGRICRYHSDMDPAVKARALERYRDGERSVIVCCHALDEGLNVPETDAGIILSVGTGERQRIQRVGRVLRRGGAGTIKNLYYIYVSGTSESPEALPELDEDAQLSARAEAVRARVPGLRYNSGVGLFYNPEYDLLAERALQALRQRGADTRLLRYADGLIARGAVRSDYLLPPDRCHELAESAAPGKRDYYRCMLLLSRARADGGTPTCTDNNEQLTTNN